MDWIVLVVVILTVWGAKLWARDLKNLFMRRAENKKMREYEEKLKCEKESESEVGNECTSCGSSIDSNISAKMYIGKQMEVDHQQVFVYDPDPVEFYTCQECLKTRKRGAWKKALIPSLVFVTLAAISTYYIDMDSEGFIVGLTIFSYVFSIIFIGVLITILSKPLTYFVENINYGISTKYKYLKKGYSSFINKAAYEAYYKVKEN